MWKKIRYLLSFSLLLFSLGLLVWSLAPVKMQVDMQSLPASRMSIKLEDGAPVTILGNRQLRLIYPSALRIGDDGVIDLFFEEVQGNGISANQRDGLVDAYANHNVMAEGELNATGLLVNPGNPIRMSMPPGQDLHFSWRVAAQITGTYTGRIWLSLRFLPMDTDTPTQVPIYIKGINIQGSSFMGFTGPMARLTGGTGVLFSLILIFLEVLRKISAEK